MAVSVPKYQLADLVIDLQSLDVSNNSLGTREHFFWPMIRYIIRNEDVALAICLRLLALSGVSLAFAGFGSGGGLAIAVDGGDLLSSLQSDISVALEFVNATGNTASTCLCGTFLVYPQGCEHFLCCTM